MNDPTMPVGSIGTNDKGLGYISHINELKISNELGFSTIFLKNGSRGEGKIEIYEGEKNDYGKDKLSILLGKLSTGGGLITYNADGGITSFLGTSATSAGHLITYNSKSKKTSFLGTNRYMDGMIIVRDKLGNLGWGKDGRIPEYSTN